MGYTSLPFTYLLTYLLTVAVDVPLWAKELTNFNVFIAADLSPMMRFDGIKIGRLCSSLCCYTGGCHSAHQKWQSVYTRIYVYTGVFTYTCMNYEYLLQKQQ